MRRDWGKFFDFGTGREFGNLEEADGDDGDRDGNLEEADGDDGDREIGNCAFCKAWDCL